jgi:hypothetical protein
LTEGAKIYLSSVRKKATSKELDVAFHLSKAK